jgi:hypothetical protein
VLPNLPTKEPDPRGNEDRAEQSPSADSVDASLPTDFTQWADPAYRAQRSAQLTERSRRAASLELSRMLNPWHASERWERKVANELVSASFDPEYVARRFGLSRRGVAA